MSRQMKTGNVTLSQRCTIYYYDHHTEKGSDIACNWQEKWKYECREIKHHGWHDDFVEIDVLCSEAAAKDLPKEIQQNSVSADWVTKGVINDDREDIYLDNTEVEKLEEQVSDLNEIINPSPETTIELKKPLSFLHKE